MTLNVHAFGAYASYTEPAWRQADYAINKFVKALKGKDFSGYADIYGMDGAMRRITVDSRHLAMQVFALWSEHILRASGLRDVVLIPVPASHCTAFHAQSCPNWMAHALQAKTPELSTVGNWLRFSQEQPKSHDGGGRDRARLRAALDVSGHCRPMTAVLIDDVKTTGAHLQVCAQELRLRGVRVEAAIVAACTVWSPHPNPYDVAVEDLDAPPLDLDAPFP